MKKMIRSSVILTLCVILCLLLSPAALADTGAEPAAETTAEPAAEPAEASADGTFGLFDYTVSEGKVTITACSPEAEGKVEIPASIDGKKVTALAANAFAGCGNVTEVVIPKGILSIGRGCFKDCSITKISLPATVETVGAEALAAKTLKSISVNKKNAKFSSEKGVLLSKKKGTVVCCPAGKTGTYTLPVGIKKIGSYAFSRSSLSSVKFPAKGKLATVSEGAFAGSSITSITLPKTVTAIGPGAFKDCAVLKTAKLPAKVTELGAEMFSGCEALTSVTLPTSLNTFGERAFAGCTSLHGVKLPKGVVRLPRGLFYGCASLSDLAFTPKIVAVEDEAFASSGLRTVTIPTAVKTIGERAFADCQGLTEIVFDHDVNDALEIGKNAFTRSGGTAATTVRVPNPNAVSGLISAYDWRGDGRTVTYDQNENITARTVQLKRAVSAYGGVEVRWERIDGADSYTVLRKLPGDTTWTSVGTAKKSPYLDKTAKNGSSYLYTVRAERDGFKSKYDQSGVNITYVAAPKLTSVTNFNGGVLIQWKKVGGAAKYRIFRKTDNSDWVKLADTDALKYSDKSVIFGKKYTYTVACLSSDGNTVLSAYDPDGLSTVYYPLPTPGGLSLTGDNGGIHVSWSAVNGAVRYRVLRKTGDGAWTKLNDTTATQYFDSSAKLGTTYTYTVRCVSADGSYFMSNYDHKGVSLRRAAVPALTSAACVNGGVEVKWASASGAVKYRVFRKVGSEKWHTLGDTTGTSWVDKTAKSGTKYVYTVRCVSSNGNFFASDYDHTGKSVTYVAAPRLQSIVGTGGGVELTWGGAKGASKYRVFRKTGSGSWEKQTDTTGTSYKDGSAVPGKSYTYTVRALASDGSYASGYNSAGLTITYAGTPALQSVQKVSGGVQIKWGKATGAAKYRVFRKVGSEKWHTLGDTTGTSWVDKTVSNGVTYIYTVRCVTSDGSTFTGGYNSAGLTITYTK